MKSFLEYLKSSPSKHGLHCLAIVGLVLTLGACNYGLKELPPVPADVVVKITIVPALDTLGPGSNLDFTATVKGSTDTAVIWRVASGPGIISSAGLYTAPATLDSDKVTVVIWAIAHADTSRHVAATIILTKDGPVSKILVDVCPTSDQLTTAQTRQLSATIAGATNTTLEWHVLSGGGSVTVNGLYTPPPSVGSSGASAVIQVRSVADTSAFANATLAVTDAPSPGAYQGPCFERDVLPILRANCAESGCHDIVKHQEGLILDTYTGIKKGTGTAPSASSGFMMVIRRTDNKRMPPPPYPPLTQAEQDTIAKWLDAGVQNTSCPETRTTCDTTNVSYSNRIVKIIQDNCLGCHFSSTSNNQFTDLHDYNGVHASAISGKLYGAIAWICLPSEYIKMPYNEHDPNTAMKLQNCDIMAIRSWILAGSPNN